MNRDYDRRRLRDLYERNRRRVLAMADARDRHRRMDDRDEFVPAPRRFLVSARTTRRAGFGEGGYQSQRGRGPSRFADESVYRSRARDRYRRVDDERGRRRRFYDDRYDRRPSRLDDRPVRRFNDRPLRRLGDRPPPRRYGDDRRPPPRRFERRIPLPRSAGGGGGRARGPPRRDPVPSKEQLDDQLDKYRRGAA